MPDQQQRAILTRIIAALAISFVALGAAAAWAPAELLPGDETGARLAHGLRFALVPLVFLLLDIASLARHRFVTPADLDGGGPASGSDRARSLQAVLQNTLEQCMLAVPVYLCWAILMPVAWQAVIPAAALLFAAGRILFRRGYPRGAHGRALGFGLTFYPSVVMLLGLVSAVLTGPR